MSKTIKLLFIPILSLVLFFVAIFSASLVSASHPARSCPAGEHAVRSLDDPHLWFCEPDSPITGGSAGVGIIDLPIPFNNLGEIVSGLLNIAYVFAGIFFLIQVVIGGIQWINAGGDPKNLESARGRITNAIIGLVIVVAAFAITLIFTTLLGVNIFTGDVVDIIP